jgi:hypothetical protein
MSDHESGGDGETRDGEERPRESEPNPTQQRLDEEGTEGAPVDVSWKESEWGAAEKAPEEPDTERSPHQGEEGQLGDIA